MKRPDEIRAALLKLAETRGPTKTFCPSEVARGLDATHWQDLIDEVRAVARELIASGVLVAKQAGQVVDMDAAKGPIRLGLKP